MKYRKPTGEDVADLLLLCAPQNILEELDLAEESKENFADDFNQLESSVKNNMYKRDMTVLALYYCNINISNNMKFHKFMKAKHNDERFYIAPEVLFNLVCVAKSEEFNDTNNLIQEMMSDVINYQDEVINQKKEELKKYQKASDVNKEKTHHLWKPYIENYKERIARGERQDVAINEIGKQIEKDGVWKKSSKKDPTKIITRPDNSTLWRNLVEKK